MVRALLLSDGGRRFAIHQDEGRGTVAIARVHGARANYCASGVPRVQGDRTQTRTTTRRLIEHHLRRRPGMASAEERLVCTRPTPDLPVPLVASAVWSGTSKVGLGCTRASTSTSVMGIHVTSSGSVNRCNFTGCRGFCGDYNMRHGFR